MQPNLAILPKRYIPSLARKNLLEIVFHWKKKFQKVLIVLIELPSQINSKKYFFIAAENYITGHSNAVVLLKNLK